MAILVPFKWFLWKVVGSRLSQNKRNTGVVTSTSSKYALNHRYMHVSYSQSAKIIQIPF